jgi:hypothetical protein
VSVSGGTLGAISQSDATHYAAVFTPTAGVDMQTATIQVVASGSGTSQWTDVAGNPGTASNTLSISEDTKPPTVVSIFAATDDHSVNLNAGHPITIALTLSEPVTVTGTPTLQLDDNEVAAYTIGSGTDELIFTYVVQPGDNVSDLHVTGLNLPNGASILDVAGNSLSGPVTADLGIQVDTTHVPPTSVQQEIMGLYAALYNRAADAGGYEFWVAVAAAQPDMHGLTLANAGTAPVSAADAQVLGAGFVHSQSAFFDQTYGNLSDSDFINAMYVNIGGKPGEEGGVQFWASVLQAAENAGQSQQDARAGVVGQFVQILSGYDINNRPPELTEQQWADAVSRIQTIDNKIAVSIAYGLASQQPDGAFLVPHVVDDDPTSPYQASIRAIQGVTADGLTADAAISNIAHAVAAQDLTLIQPVGILNDALHM